MGVGRMKNAGAPRLSNGTYAPRVERVSLVCCGCGRSFLRYISLVGATRTYCSTACRRKWVSHPCPQCGAQVNKNRQYCSKKCHDTYQSRNKVECICVECSAKFLVSPSRIIYDPTRYCSENCYRKSSSMRDVLIANNLKMQKSKQPTKLERDGEEILKEVGVLYATQILVGGKFVVDAIIPSHSLIIQWDGDYWHGYGISDWRLHPEKRVQKRMYGDISQDSYFKTCGYTVLRFWEHEVENDRESVKARIASIIREGAQ